ncbi:hypothetical protein [Nannocystis exedens]|uniref:hypothetical protein n=1 Tax=Nannocystis exedens TaxID=54 RepID=UPI000BBA0C23|nr:hypothetical protein [Nannocystis exedens]PCC68929.1 Serine/threonine-protein kinase PknH [Nannocystis exedens]
MPEAFAPAAGQRFAGRFELSALLRGSGPARVFTTSDGSARPLVLVLFDPAACTPTAWSELMRVVTAATERALPGVVPLRNVPPAPPDPPFCLADPPVGWSFDRLRKGGPPSWQKQGAPAWERALRLGERAAAILEAAHAALGVPHRALVPQRLVVTEADELLILDFGVGELEPVAGRADDCGYRAPEQANSRGDVRSDVFSLASVLFELIAGERPSPKLPPRLRSLVPGVPRAVDDLFAEALAVEPWQRYAGMGELREAMREALGLGPAPAVSLSASVVRSTPPAAEAPPNHAEIDLSRSDLPVLPGSASAPAPASATPPSSGSIGSSPPGRVATPTVELPAPPGPARSIVSAPPGGVTTLPLWEPPASPSPAGSSASTPGRVASPTLELPPAPSPAGSSVSAGRAASPTLELPPAPSPAGASVSSSGRMASPTLELPPAPSPAGASGSTPGRMASPTLELPPAPSPAGASVSAGRVASPTLELPPAPSPAGASGSTPGAVAQPSAEPSSPSPARSKMSGPLRGPLLPPLELPPTRSNASTPPRGPILPPVEPLPVRAMPSSPSTSVASAANKTEIDWTRPRPGTSSASARPLQYSKLLQPDPDEVDVLGPRSNPPAAKTEVVPQPLVQAAFTPAKTEVVPQPLVQAAFTPARTEVVPQPLVQASVTSARTEHFPRSPAGPAEETIELPSQSMARLRFGDESTHTPAAHADRAEHPDEDESAPAHRPARTEIFVSNSVSGRAERTEILVGDDATAARSERTEMLSPGPAFAEPPHLERGVEAQNAAVRSAQPTSAPAAARQPAPRAPEPAKASGPPIKLLLITVNVVLLVVIVLVLALR